MVHSLLYVSKTLLVFPAGAAEVTQIVERARVRNARLGVTGALISTGIYFAQLLEGSQPAVAELMRGIDADPRHMRLKIIRTTEEARRLPGWSLAYSGHAGFVDRHIAPLFATLAEGDAAHLAMSLIALMQEFARLPPPI